MCGTSCRKSLLVWQYAEENQQSQHQWDITRRHHIYRWRMAYMYKVLWLRLVRVSWLHLSLSHCRADDDWWFSSGCCWQEDLLDGYRNQPHRGSQPGRLHEEGSGLAKSWQPSSNRPLPRDGVSLIVWRPCQLKQISGCSMLLHLLCSLYLPVLQIYVLDRLGRAC